ncbi:hypothetical protein [Stagnihabitans tardus]|uniref:Uncharacterized protein n=1 Tax=Stagnihabitans tardus TaxID=2699202 RepID=A0AAE4YAG1_9RHOB|nr:hypothetical protein [Stagnihabitans tardus]NBZ87713.1 hypothetical protein [Stagnihabitans tardus]
MGQLRHLICLCLTLASGPSLGDELRTFATCTGRLSALMEHQWLMQDPAADLTKRQRDAFADLVQAVALDPARAMSMRIEAKAATAAALQAADFGGHPAARTRVMAQVRSCLRLLPQA